MKIIFLDYDGVVNTVYFDSPDKKPKYNWPNDNKVNNIQAIGWLNELYEIYSYSIVVSSTWRSKENYKECLYNAGLNPNIEILGKTPNLTDYDNNLCRGDEIQTWLDHHKDLEIEDFIILDDCENMGHLKLHYIQTDTMLGFTYYDFTKIKYRWSRIDNENTD